ncbi:hypothetical protein K438DRAFT_2017785 [Mycena galopus ATCC 62051]|nr:hypothetical protein K438DRAFT_2017785 [Mycena galopus ATCC 62051]
MPVAGDPVPRTVLKATRPWRTAPSCARVRKPEARPVAKVAYISVRRRCCPALGAALRPPLDGDIDLILQPRRSSSAVVPDFVRTTCSFIARSLPTTPLTLTAPAISFASARPIEAHPRDARAGLATRMSGLRAVRCRCALRYPRSPRRRASVKPTRNASR